MRDRIQKISECLKVASGGVDVACWLVEETEYDADVKRNLLPMILYSQKENIDYVLDSILPYFFDEDGEAERQGAFIEAHDYVKALQSVLDFQQAGYPIEKFCKDLLEGNPKHLSEYMDKETSEAEELED